MPRLAICSRDLHWHWINRTLLCDTMEVSVLSRAWLTIAQHVFQPALTGRPELISRKIVSGEPGTKAIAVSRFREKLSPANWVQGVTAISRKISRSWALKKMGSNMRPRYIQFRDIHDRDISGLHCTEIADRLMNSEVEIQTYFWESPCNHITGRGLPILVTAITTGRQGAVVIHNNECFLSGSDNVLCCAVIVCMKQQW